MFDKTLPRRTRVITMLHENCDTYLATGETVSEKRWTLFKTKMMDSLYVRRHRPGRTPFKANNTRAKQTQGEQHTGRTAQGEQQPGRTPFKANNTRAKLTQGEQHTGRTAFTANNAKAKWTLVDLDGT